MHYNGEVTLGSILIMLSMLGSAIAVVVGVRAELTSLKSIVSDLSARLQRHEDIVFSLSGHLQHVIGRMEPRPDWKRTRTSD